MRSFQLSSYIPLKNRLFLRILLYFLSFLLPILIIGAFLYIHFHDTAKKDFKQKIQLNLEASAEFIDVYLQTAQRSSLSFYSDKNVMSYLLPYRLYDPADRVNLPNIPYTLARISNNIGELIDNIFVFVDDEKVYTKDGLENFNYFFNNIYQFTAYDQSFWRSKINTDKYLEQLKPSKVTVTNSVEKTAIPFVFAKTVNGHQAAMVMTVSVERIANTIQKNGGYSSTNYLIFDSSKEIIWSSSKDLIPPNSWLGEDGFTREQISSGELLIDGHKFVLTSVKSGTYGWTYYAVTPYTEFTKQSTQIFATVASICIILLMVGCVLSFVFAYNLYSPIQKIRDILMQDGDESDYTSRPLKKGNELEWIGMGIHQIIEKNNIFKQKLDSFSTDYIDYVLLNAVSGTKPVNEQELEKLLKEELQFNEESFVCCKVVFSYKPAFYEEIQDVERLLIINKIKKIIDGFVAQYVPAYILESKQNVFVCLVNINENEGLNELRGAMLGIVQTFRQDSRYCSIHIGIGKIYAGISGISKSYKDAVTSLEHADTRQDFLITELTDMSKERNIYSYKTDQLVSTIVTYIEEHYGQDLYLEKIAEQMGVSSKYISKVFKEKKGINLTDYISMIRIMKAKEILMNTDRNISDISEQVGIYSRTTFIRLFKKFEGLPPNEFRKNKGYKPEAEE
ncbi:helix-turn-helix domain-containing protein [Paenibacillus sp. LMG 31456]|uniref:Helix-turn-helix domain-containing protein n=1 Tax=Paenibacillus foliorum TaxID=2654974 RepID=A0A972GPX6_9BACL|nr:helix-turn-helix domain-containing protein [Paenibacillus foliorum]NOU94228.1 helix-turn-helix domain-containing protein [Paenibacillus foliorum]